MHSWGEGAQGVVGRKPQRVTAQCPTGWGVLEEAKEECARWGLRPGERWGGTGGEQSCHTLPCGQGRGARVASMEGHGAWQRPRGICDSQSLLHREAGPGGTITLVSHFQLSPFYCMIKPGFPVLTLGFPLWATFSNYPTGLSSTLGPLACPLEGFNGVHRSN